MSNAIQIRTEVLLADVKTDSGRSSLRLFLSPTAEELTLMENGTRRRQFPFILFLFLQSCIES